MAGAKQQRPNSGVLFENDRKEHENHADMQGSINVDGKEYWINGWRKQGRSQFLSLSVKPKEKLAKSVQKQASQSSQKIEPEDGNWSNTKPPF